MIKDKIIVVPDVHGRTFWKTIKENQYSDYEIVFLGDYLDPYTQAEKITAKQAYDNFLEIIEFAKENKDRVHLLIGNHDAHYLSLSDDSCRMDYIRRVDIFKIFSDNKELFNIAYRWNNTLFTHAGVTTKWLSQNEKISNINKDNVEYTLNNMFHSAEWEFPEAGWDGLLNFTYTPLGDIGRYRGGYAPFGSCIWADANEMMYCSAFYDVENTDNPNNDLKLNIELYQITGHTRLNVEKTFIHPESNWWMCDSRCCFIWDEKEETLKTIDNEND